MNDGRLEIVWKGELVGYLADAEAETIHLGHSSKIKGRWIPVALPDTHAFTQLLSESPVIEIDEDTPGMRTFFSLGLDGEAWLYRRDLMGWKRFADMLKIKT